jgi:hypothetical protein
VQSHCGKPGKAYPSSLSFFFLRALKALPDFLKDRTPLQGLKKKKRRAFSTRGSGLTASTSGYLTTPRRGFPGFPKD